MWVNLSNLPSPKKVYQTYYRDLSGGLSTKRLPSEIADNQCSELKNMLWENGVLRSRRGMERLPLPTDPQEGLQGFRCYSMYERLWHGYCLFINDTGGETMELRATNAETGAEHVLYSYDDPAYGGSATRGDRLCGSFFPYMEKLYYKNRGVYIAISYDEETDTFSVAEVEGYVPIIQINTGTDGVGDLYQPENRLSDKKTIWYNAASGERTVEIFCDGEETVFDLGYSNATVPQLQEVRSVYVGAALQEEETNYTINFALGTISMTVAPLAVQKITVNLTVVEERYQLPVKGATIESVYVDDELWSAIEEPAPLHDLKQYYADYSGEYPAVLFDRQVNLGYIGDANSNANRIKVTYSLPNEDAKKAIDDCHIATVFGSTGIEAHCIVMAGSTEQPNAYFWSGSDANGGNPAYFPMEQYNLAGTYYDEITAFGRQQNKLVIFQTGRVGSASYALTELYGRTIVQLNYMSINDRMGCDLPKTVQLVENNLVWASTEHGVLYLKDSTYAYETLVVGISGNVNDPGVNCPGLISDIRNGERRLICSADDGSRYWLCANGHAYVWDYSLQGYTGNTEKLCWFYQDGIEASAWLVDNHELIGLLPVTDPYTPDWGDGTWRSEWLFRFTKEAQYTDFGAAYERVCRPKELNFGTLGYAVNVDKMITAVDPSEPTWFEAEYYTDQQIRKDLTPLMAVTWKFAPRDLSYRSLLVTRGPMTLVRKPKCRHIRSFAVRFVTNKPQRDMNIISVQFMHTYQGAMK